MEKTKLPNTGGGQIQFIKWGKQLCEELKRTKFHTDWADTNDWNYWAAKTDWIAQLFVWVNFADNFIESI